MEWKLLPVIDGGLVITKRYTLSCQAVGKVAAVEFFNQGTSNLQISYAGVTRIVLPGRAWSVWAPTMAYLITEYNLDFIQSVGQSNNAAISIQKYTDGN